MGINSDSGAGPRIEDTDLFDRFGDEIKTEWLNKLRALGITNVGDLLALAEADPEPMAQLLGVTTEVVTELAEDAFELLPTEVQECFTRFRENPPSFTYGAWMPTNMAPPPVPGEDALGL